MRLLKLTYYLLFTLASVISLSGCSQDEYMEKQDIQQPKIEAQLILSVSTPQSVRAAGTTTLKGKAVENECRKLTLFIMNTDGSNIQDYSVTGESLQNKSLFFNVVTEQGQKLIFVAVNMSDAQIANIKEAKDHNPAYTINNITDITTDNNFLMTGQAVTESGNNIINIEAEKTTKVKATLTRVMSKVLLTCSTKDGDDKYVKLAQDNGYIRLSNVRYILDTTNKKFFPFVKSNNEDPNFKMSETLGNLSNNFFAIPPSNTVDNRETAIKYDASRVQEGEHQYTEGIYCLENTINIDQQDVTRAKDVATYLMITAKFTPKNIDGIRNLSENDANQKLTPDGTFYICKKAPAGTKDMCYSTISNGINYLKNDYATNVTADDFTTYTGGWQYYETFVNSPVFGGGASLVRNNYYIINITSFTAPLLDKTIEVNTIIREWAIKGKTTIDVETSNN